MMVLPKPVQTAAHDKDEQAQLKTEAHERQVETLQQFIQRVHKYAALDGLTAYAVYELIRSIYIEFPDRTSGPQGIRIVSILWALSRWMN